MLLRNVTFVIATYKRVEALRCTLQSLILQDYQDWIALVIGDCCGKETAEMIHTLGESRIQYYNLPERFGEQSGPNSFGLHLAEGDFVCFLNHDDLLLPDHLKYSLDIIDKQAADFHIGLCANATELKFEENGNVVPVFTSILPPHKDLSFLILRDPLVFDPSSFWLTRASYAKAVGPWKPSTTLWRTPLRDWLMRAWRLRGKFSFSDKVTGLRFWTQNLRKESPLYTNITPEHDYMIRLCQKQSPDEIRQFIWQQLEKIPKYSFHTQTRDSRFSLSLLEKYWNNILRKTMTLLFLRSGLDPLVIASKLLRRPKGKLHKKLLEKRTGEYISKMPDIEKFIQDAETYRVF